MQGYISSVTYCCVSLPSKHSSWWRRLEDVLETYFVAVFKTSSRRLDQDEYIRLSHTSSGDVLIKMNKFALVIHLQDVFKTSSRRLAKTMCASTDVFSCGCCDIFKNTYFEKHQWAAASKNQHLSDKITEGR